MKGDTKFIADLAFAIRYEPTENVLDNVGTYDIVVLTDKGNLTTEWTYMRRPEGEESIAKNENTGEKWDGFDSDLGLDEVRLELATEIAEALGCVTLRNGSKQKLVVSESGVTY